MDNQAYLKNELYYEDLFDLGTIKSCLDFIETWKGITKESCDKEIKTLSDEDFQRTIISGLNINLYSIKGERYRRKKSTIQEWTDKDRKRDEKLANAQEPQDILCPKCNRDMKLEFKYLYDFNENDLRVLFFFECTACKKRRGVFDNGEPFFSKPEPCPKCGNKLNYSITDKKKKTIWIKACSSCDFKDVEVDDFDKKEVEREKKRIEDQGLLKKHRAEFCLSEKEGEEYILGCERLKEIAEFLENAKKKQQDPNYQKALKLKKLKIGEVEKLLTDTLEKEKYVKLMLEKPEIDRYVVVPFTIQDSDSARKENDSITKLRKLLKKSLETTNWRLMSEGVNYRLGYLSGRLKGYEHEDDLMQLVRSGLKKVGAPGNI